MDEPANVSVGITDLIEISKPSGRKLAGKEIWLIASGTDVDLPDGFEVPFLRTAQYFDMRYRGACYLFTGSDAGMRDRSEEALAVFGKRVLEADHWQGQLGQ